MIQPDYLQCHTGVHGGSRDHYKTGSMQFTGIRFDEPIDNRPMIVTCSILFITMGLILISHRLERRVRS